MTRGTFDVIVVGGGHAGVEASAVSARMGAKTALITQRFSTIGAMSCNPAIGGLGKGHLVKEIDALDGLMGCAADAAAIQFRLLNRSKGPAVQGPRIQADRKRYAQAVNSALRRTAGLTLYEGECVELLMNANRVSGVELKGGVQFGCGAVILTTGTFLNGVIHKGSERFPGGRIGDAASQELSNQFRAMGFTVGRLKTGTPPRIDGKSIRLDELEPQWGDEKPHYLSSLTRLVVSPQTLCYLTRTTERTHQIVRNNLSASALYSGAISGAGPRYCPSLEDKIVKFANKESHQIFLEPEGLEDDLVYPNGISTSLPIQVQRELIASIPGLERAKIVQPGYAIEYDYINPTQLHSTLMTRGTPGLFLAGQINGTTGYEEAAGQGIVAGINAALFAGQATEQIFDRKTSYLGVMIDDLTTFGVTEPYRMFTSRAECRLSMRADNADERLTPFGQKVRAVGSFRSKEFAQTTESLTRARAVLKKTTLSSTQLRNLGIAVTTNGRKTAFEWAGMSQVELKALVGIQPELASIDEDLLPRLDADAKYHIHIERQREQERQSRDDNLEIPEALNLDLLPGLSSELKTKFREKRPRTIGQASRYEGVTPAALLLLSIGTRRFT